MADHNESIRKPIQDGRRQFLSVDRLKPVVQEKLCICKAIFRQIQHLGSFLLDAFVHIILDHRRKLYLKRFIPEEHLLSIYGKLLFQNPSRIVLVQEGAKIDDDRVVYK